MNIKYHIELNNDYEFKSHCTQKSIETFEFAIKNNLPPSRLNLLIVLISDTITAPIYLTQQSAELAFDIFRIINLKTEDKKNSEWFVIDLSKVIFFQLFIPVVCTAIRISATALGLIFPSLALKGWKIAENGELLASSLWQNIFKDLNCYSSAERIFKEIHPSNAVYYLGKKFTYKALQVNSEDLHKLDETIINEFKVLLLKMASHPSCCLDILLDYDKATHPKTTLNKKGIPCLISHDIKKILLVLKVDSTDKEKVVDVFLKKSFTIEECHKIFFYINLNLNNMFFENQAELKDIEIDNRITQLKDLFSKRFGFGRANLPLSFYNIYSSSMQ